VKPPKEFQLGLPPKLRPEVARHFAGPDERFSMKPFEAMDGLFDVGPGFPKKRVGIPGVIDAAVNDDTATQILNILSNPASPQARAAAGQIDLPESLRDSRIRRTVTLITGQMEQFPHRRRKALLRELDTGILERVDEEMLDLKEQHNTKFWTSVEEYEAATGRKARVMRRLDPDKTLSEQNVKSGSKLMVAKAKREWVKDKRSAAELAMQGAALIMIEALEKHPRLMAAEGSLYHKLQEAEAEGGIINPFCDDGLFLNVAGAAPTLHGAPITMVVGHDWARVFDKADEIGAEWRLPGDLSAFEFQVMAQDRGVGTTRAIAIWCAENGLPLDCSIYIRAGRVWVQAFAGRFENGKLVPDREFFFGDTAMPNFALLLERQTRAICIMLDAEVAVMEVVRAPHKLNHERAKRGKPALLDYHVVNLTHRTRVAPRLPDGEAHEPRFHKRLHWVRGHWRRYEGDFKTWIKWHLRGNPDLGFIDKEYKL
jgi:hypothetical protein